MTLRTDPDIAASSPTPGAAVAIVLVNYRDARDTLECLDSLLALQYPAFEIFVVDNDSRDDSLDELARWCERPQRVASWQSLPGVGSHVLEANAVAVAHRRIAAGHEAPATPVLRGGVTLVASEQNLGFAGGCNLGIVAAGGRFDYLWLLNTDTVVRRDALSELIGRALADPGTGLIGATVRYYDRPEQVQALAGAAVSARGLVFERLGDRETFPQGLPERTAVEKRLAFILGASMLVSRAFCDGVGPMQEDYFLYFEEYDWALRGGDRWTLGWAPGAEVFHKGGGSSTRSSAHTFSMQLRYRNLVRFVARFLPVRLAEVRRQMWGTLLRYLAQGRWRGIWVVGGTLRQFSSLVASARPGDPPTPTPLDAQGRPKPVALDPGR